MEWNTFHRHLDKFPREEIERIHAAYDLGWKAHGTQIRKSGEPYFHHPIIVAAMLADMKADPDTIIAALLHDTLEDTELKAEEIESQFGPNVLSLVRGVTKLSQEDFRDQPTLNEQVETLRKMFTLMQKDVRIMVIKLVDRLHNMKTVQFLPVERQRALAKETIDVYVKIADRLCMQDLRDELEGFCLQVLEPETFHALKCIDDDGRVHEGEALHAISQRLHTHPSVGPTVAMFIEPKSWDALRRQHRVEGAAAVGVSAATAVFVCPDRDSCYRVMGALHECWKRETMSFQDFINAPQINGYRGLHTTIILEDGTRVRCKIRTKEMHAYARQGIASLCFSAPGKGLTDALEWTEHISSLSADTQGHSTAFWESLRSDILGEAMIVHGPSDEAVHLPQGATALDGALYLFREIALRARNIKVNGEDVPFSTPVHPGDAITISVANELTVRREWLQAVRTGLATAMIRTSLSATHSPEEKLLLGRALLQKVLEERHQGYIEEFRQQHIETALRSLGLASLSDAYIALADGRIEARSVYAALFENTVKGSKVLERPERQNLHYTADTSDSHQMDRLTGVHHSFRDMIEEVRYRQSGTITVRVNMNKSTLQKFIEQLSRNGAQNIEVSAFAVRLGVAGVSILLVVLWGLDPAIAKFLLSQLHVSTVDMTIVRFLTLSAMSALLLWWKRTKNVLRPARLPLNKSSLWLSAFLFFIIGISTYGALQLTTPLGYTIPMTSAGMLITSMAERRNRMKILLAWFICLLGLGILVSYTAAWSRQGIALTLLAVLSFTAFWAISERYKRMERVSFRSVEFFFILSSLCGAFSIFLLPLSGLWHHNATTILAMVLFSAIFVGTPYYLLYSSSHLAVWLSSRYSFATILITAFAQFFLFHTLNVSGVIAGSIIVAGALILSINKKGSESI